MLPDRVSCRACVGSGAVTADGSPADRLEDGAQTCRACKGTGEPPAARIRALHAAEPALTRRQLADRTGTTQQAVQSALRARHDRPGRPRKVTAGPGETCRCAP